jgi:uncharacterized protein (DUF488 family)
MSSSLFTIGHGTRPLSTFLDLLEKFHIDFLIDVRSIPWSAFNPQYRQTTLAHALQQRNIRYVYMGDALGGRPTDPSCYSGGKVNYEALQQKDFFLQGIERLKAAHEKDVRAALLCSESNPAKCHRSRLIGRFLHQQNIPLQHIDENGTLCEQAILIPALF